MSQQQSPDASIKDPDEWVSGDVRGGRPVAPAPSRPPHRVRQRLHAAAPR